MSNGRPAWVDFLKDAGGPIGVTVSIILGVLFVGWLLGAACSAMSDSPEEKAFDVQCQLVGGTVEKLYDHKYCANVSVIKELPVPEMETWKRECKDLGGYPYQRNFVDACYKIDIIEELGARDDYVGGSDDEN